MSSKYCCPCNFRSCFALIVQTVCTTGSAARNTTAIKREFEGVRSIEIRATDADVTRYITERIKREHRLARHVRSDPGLLHIIVTRLLDKAKGMFLLIQLHMDSLVHKNNRKAIHDALEKLPREVDDTYEEAMKRIQGQNQDDAELADQVLLWICFARRPLSIVELQHALAVDESSTSTQWDALPDEEIMISVCCGLVVIDEESSIVRLVHYTTQEYFDRTRESRYPHAQDRILNTCLKCISFEGINLRFSQTQNPLLDYAETNWYFHALGNLRSDTQNVLLRFLQDEAKAKRYGELMLVNEPYIDSGDIGSFGLMMGTHIAAYLGLHDILASLLERGMATNSSGPANRTPLSFAARQGHQMVVGLLLSRADVDVNCEDAYDCTPLHAALKFGRVNVVDQLLEAGANVSKEDNRGRIPLHLAAARGGLGVAGKLVRAGSDINACDDRGKTPLDYLDELLEER